MLKKNIKKTLETIQGQTKKKTPKKREPKPKKDEGGYGPKKQVNSGAAIRKLILKYK